MKTERIEYIDDILIFESEYLNSKKHGKGKKYFKNAAILFHKRMGFI